MLAIRYYSRIGCCLGLDLCDSQIKSSAMRSNPIEWQTKTVKTWKISSFIRPSIDANTPIPCDCHLKQFTLYLLLNCFVSQLFSFCKLNANQALPRGSAKNPPVIEQIGKPRCPVKPDPPSAELRLAKIFWVFCGFFVNFGKFSALIINNLIGLN